MFRYISQLNHSIVITIIPAPTTHLHIFNNNLQPSDTVCNQLNIMSTWQLPSENHTALFARPMS